MASGGGGYNAGDGGKVERFKGFTELTHRILYEFGTPGKFETPNKEGAYPGFMLFTVLKDGTIENRKALMSKPGKGLIGFGISQTIEEKHVKTIQDAWETREAFMKEKVTKAEAAGGDAEAVAKAVADAKELHAASPGLTADTLPFISKRTEGPQSGSYAVVHVWTANVDDKFKARFTIADENPSPKHFEPQAVEEYKAAMVKLFGKEAEKHKPQFATAQQKNDYPVFIGLGKDLIKMLKDDEAIRKEMCILKVEADHFVGEVINFNWKTKEKTTGQKEFYLSLENKHVLYIKTGGDKMPAVKPFELFDMEAVLDK